MKTFLTTNQYLSLAFALASVAFVASSAHANSRYGDIHQDLSAPRGAAPQAPNFSDDSLNSVNAQTPSLRTLWHVRSTARSVIRLTRRLRGFDRCRTAAVAIWRLLKLLLPSVNPTSC